MEDTVMRAPFEASIFNLWGMRAQADRIAKDLGLSGEEADAFRHAYVSAKMQEAYGEHVATDFGELNEYGRDKLNKLLSGWKKGNPRKDWDMDLFNNEVGRKIEKELQAEPAEKERVLRLRVYEAVKNGELQTDRNKPVKPPPEKVKELKKTSASGDIWVSAYSRRTGDVRRHLRSRPDGNPGNNRG